MSAFGGALGNPIYLQPGETYIDYQRRIVEEQRKREMEDMADGLMTSPSSVGEANPLSGLVGETGIRGLDYISTMNPDQQAIFKMLMERMMSGGFTGDRVAGMTSAQTGILGGLEGLTKKVSAPRKTTPDFQKLLASRGFEGVVGENGPQVIEAKRDIRITPNRRNPLENIRRMATGGILKKGKKAIVGERGPERVSPLAGDGGGIFRDPAQLKRKKGTSPIVSIVPQVKPPTEAEYHQKLGEEKAVWEKLPTKEKFGSKPSTAGYKSTLARPATGTVQGAKTPLSLGTTARKPLGATPTGRTGAVNPLATQTQSATARALSGRPSTTIDTATTEEFIRRSIADPARKAFEEGTLQQIKSSYAGPGYWGSARAGAEVKGRENVEANILARGSEARYKDEQARRGLAEAAAGRSLAAIPTALNVQNNPLLQQQIMANVGQTLAGIGLTEANTQRVTGLIQQDIATTGQISAQTERIMADIGMTAAQIEQVKSRTALSDAALLQAEQNYRAGEQQMISQQIQQLMQLFGLASTEQTQEQNELMAKYAEWLENDENFKKLAEFLLSQQTQTAVVNPLGQ